MKKYLLFVFLPLILFFTSCQKNFTKDPVSKSAYLLNTIITISIYDKHDEAVFDETFDLIKDYEKVFSRTDKDSELYKLNNRELDKTLQGGYIISNELAYVISESIRYANDSNGNFDISIAPLSDLWDFNNLKAKVPSSKDIAKLLPYVDYKKIKLIDKEVYFENDHIKLDLGGIAKGYIADKIKEFLLSKNIHSAIINLGGNVLTIGSKLDGSPFNIGLQKPFANRSETISVLEIKDLTVVSSGVYERFFYEGTTLYHHILNPRTGYPYNNDLLSVTIITNNSKDADAISTICLSLGLEEGLKFINNIPNAYAVFITKEYDIIYSNDFTNNIEIKNN